MTKGLIYQEHVPFINIYVPHIYVPHPKILEAKLAELKGEIDESTIRAGRFQHLTFNNGQHNWAKDWEIYDLDNTKPTRPNRY